ncbi:MAG: TonB family protein [Candidatus Delongbacteria bacterium]|nr:TonB family protein [Candidatus Delongbacteria bacterium]
MKKQFLIYLLISYCLNLSSQVDTIRFNSEWIVDKNDCDYYMVLNRKSEDSTYDFWDYHISNELYGFGKAMGQNIQERTGNFIYYYKNGNIKEQGKFESGAKVGCWKGFYENGEIWYIENYINGKRDGEWIRYHLDGSVHIRLSYKNEELISKFFFNKQGDSIDNPECDDHIPYFKDNRIEPNEFRNFISQNLIYPKSASKKRIDGTVILQFKVDEFGNIVGIKVTNNPPEILRNAAIETKKLCPKWIPGRQFCKYVKVTFNFPINYGLK